MLLLFSQSELTVWAGGQARKLHKADSVCERRKGSLDTRGRHVRCTGRGRAGGAAGAAARARGDGPTVAGRREAWSAPSVPGCLSVPLQPARKCITPVKPNKKSGVGARGCFTPPPLASSLREESTPDANNGCVRRTLSNQNGAASTGGSENKVRRTRLCRYKHSALPVSALSSDGTVLSVEVENPKYF
jgi:hypothetical protein